MKLNRFYINKKGGWIIFLWLIGAQLWAQTNDSRVITTAVPFLLISPDARASGMGDQGVATTPDAYSQYWNASKYNFLDKDFGFGISYTPYLSRLINDINLVYLTHFGRINNRSAYGFGLRYFGLGQIQLTDINGEDMGTVSPNEFALDGSYTLKLSDNFSTAVTMRFILSDLKLETSQADATAAKDFAVDLSGYYQSDEFDMGEGKGTYRWGFNIQNLGPKIKYYNSSEGDFLPTNLRLGAGLDYRMDPYNTLRFQAETNKLLVPTPPVRNDTTGAIIAGRDDNVGWIQGIFQSFTDAPGGLKEEWQEFTWSLAMEYEYMEAFKVRAGYFHESQTKGKRQYLTFGAGITFHYMIIDLSYLFSTSQLRTPLDGTLRVSASFFLDKKHAPAPKNE